MVPYYDLCFLFFELVKKLSTEFQLEKKTKRDNKNELRKHVNVFGKALKRNRDVGKNQENRKEQKLDKKVNFYKTW